MVAPLPESKAAFSRRLAQPKVSVLVPTYNYARFLPAAIESIQAQDFADFEILISDDCSADDSAGLLRHYAAADPRIRLVIHPTNLGMVANWNWCLQKARGDYVKFLFGDDLLTSSSCLTQLAAQLDANPATALVASARLLLDENSNVTGCWDDLPPGGLDGPRLIARCLRTRRNLVGEPSAVMFRRSLAGRGFDPAYRQMVDLEMWCHLLMQGGLAYVPAPLCGFRRHTGQQTVVNTRTRVTDLELMALLDRYLALPSVHRHLQPNSLAHRQILFRQMHYARKAAAQHEWAALAVARLETQVPLHWQIGLGTWHRLTRPLENLNRKIKLWTKWCIDRAWRPAAARRARWERFLYSLPSLKRRTSP